MVVKAYRYSWWLVWAFALLVNSCGALTAGVSEAQSEFNEGLGFFNQGRYEEAVAPFRKAGELDPSFGRTYLYLGRSYVYLKRWPEAISALRTAYKLLPDETKSAAFDILIDALFAASHQGLRPEVSGPQSKDKPRAEGAR